MFADVWLGRLFFHLEIKYYTCQQHKSFYTCMETASKLLDDWSPKIGLKRGGTSVFALVSSHASCCSSENVELTITKMPIWRKVHVAAHQHVLCWKCGCCRLRNKHIYLTQNGLLWTYSHTYRCAISKHNITASLKWFLEFAVSFINTSWSIYVGFLVWGIQNKSTWPPSFE